MPARLPADSRRSDHHQELLELLETRDRLAEEWREETRQHREEVRALDSRIVRVRDILAGRDHHQELIPGTEVVALQPKKAKKSRRRCKHGTEIGSGGECQTCRADAAWEKEHADTLKKSGKTSKKFPLGGDEREKCTTCGRERGEHAGSRCPAEIPDLKTGTKAEGAKAARDLEKRIHHEPEDDDPARPLHVTDEVEGVTYEAKPNGHPELLRFPGLKDGQTHADLVVPGRQSPERYIIEKIAGGKFRWFIIGKKYSTPFSSFVAARNAAEADARRRVAEEAA